MKKKFNIKTYIIGIITGLIFAGTFVSAAILYQSEDVGYDNTNSELTSENVQDALDELNTRTNTWINPNNNFGTPQYYAFGGPYKGWCNSTDSSCNSNSDFPTTSTTPPSGKNVYSAKYADGGYGVCIKRNGTEHCFRGRNWIAEAQHLQKVFSDISCNDYSSRVLCDASDFGCRVYSDGFVRCNDYSAYENCYVETNGYVYCFS